MYVLVIKINYFDNNLYKIWLEFHQILHILIVTKNKNKIKQTKPNDYSLLR